MQSCILIGLAILSLSPLTDSLCNRVSRVEIRYKEYFWNYLHFNETFQRMEGIYAYLIKEAVNGCCKGVGLQFIKENSTTKDVEELALHALIKINETVPKPFIFYYPEFAANKEKIVYDFELKFVKLSRSAGHAAVMLRPKSKKKVSLVYVLTESLPMLLMMLTMSWCVGILGWIAVSIKQKSKYTINHLHGELMAVLSTIFSSLDHLELNEILIL